MFKGDQTIAEHAETEVVTGLTALPENRFAYSVSNGTVGVYEQDVRLWRVKVTCRRVKSHKMHSQFVFSQRILL